MEDDKLKNLFAGFDPELSDDAHFMSQVVRSLQAVEFAKQQCARVQRVNRISVAVASIVGFLCGMAFTLSYPYLLSLLDGFRDMGRDVAWMISEYGDLMVWIICSVFTCVLTYVGYDLSQLVLSMQLSQE